MKKIIVCDDDKVWLSKAVAIIEDFGLRKGLEFDICTCLTPEAISACFDSEPEVVFMDIEFDESERSDADNSGTNIAEGIRAAARINSMYPDCHIVYLTNYLQYALDVYGTEHVWYVTKEQFESRLPEIFDKIRRMDDDLKAELVIKEADGSQTRIFCSSIRYMERRDRKTVIHTTDDEYTVRMRIPEILDNLPEGSFCRCHTSFIVNLAKVRTINDKSLTLDDGTELFISRGFNKPFRIKYMNWAGSRSVN